MAEITSRRNPMILNTVRLQDKKERTRTGLFITEGRKLYLEALASGIIPENIICTEDYFASHREELEPYRASCTTVTADVFDRITQEKAPEGILCVCRQPKELHRQCDIYTDCGGALFAASGLQDPGNLGTLIRTAAAFGIDELLLDRECADIYSLKTVRASMGAVFRMKICICGDLASSLRAIGERRTVYAAALDRSAVRLGEIVTDPQSVFVVGNEGHGLTPEMISACTRTVFIEMEPDAESLNASQAATVLLWERYRASGK